MTTADPRRAIVDAAAADRAADEILVTLLSAEWTAAERPAGGERDDLTDDARRDAALIVANYTTGGRPLGYLVDALTTRAVDAWLAVGRLLGIDPVTAMQAADAHRDGAA